MKKIIIDTNFLMIPFKFKVDIFSEFRRVCDFNYELFIFEQSISELKNIIERQRGKDRIGAKLALNLIKIKNIGIIKTEEKDVDLLILENVGRNNVIATQDLILKKELKNRGSPVIILRNKKYLQLV